jgi:hypothetical protein
MYLNAIDRCARRCITPPAAEKVNAVTARHESSEYLMEMKLCATGLGIFTVLPVQNENAH